MERQGIIHIQSYTVKPNDSVDIDSYVDALLTSIGSTSPTDGVPLVAVFEPIKMYLIGRLLFCMKQM